MAEGQQASVPIQSLLMQINADAVCLVRTQFQQLSRLITRRSQVQILSPQPDLEVFFRRQEEAAGGAIQIPRKAMRSSGRSITRHSCLDRSMRCRLPVSGSFTRLPQSKMKPR